eukprot:scaffold4610_cov180-Ochromonas_danica.AAC.3
MIAYSRADPSSFGTTDDQIAVFERLLVSIDQNLMIGEIFKGCVEQNFEEVSTNEDGGVEEMVIVRHNSLFLDGELMHTLKLMIETSVPVIGTTNEANERNVLLGSLGLYALYRQLLPPHIAPDTKLHRLVWAIQKAVPTMIISESAVFYVGEFLLQHAPLDSKKLDPPHPGVFRKQFIQQFDSLLNQRTQTLLAQCKAWMILAESRLQSSLALEVALQTAGAMSAGAESAVLSTLQVLDLYGSILLRGLSLVKRASYLAKYTLIMHTNMQVPLSRTNLNDVAQLLEMVKAMDYTFLRKDSVIAEYLVLILRNISDSLFARLNLIKLKLESTKKVDGKFMVLHGVAALFEELLRSTDTWSTCRQISLHLFAEIILAAPPNVLKNDREGQKIHSSCSKLIALANLVKEVRAATDCSFIYFHTSLLQPIIRSIYQIPTECNRLHYLYSVYEDGVKLPQAVLHDNEQRFVQNFHKVICDPLKVEIIEPLCKDIETDLRLHIHTKHLDHMVALNPKTENLRPLKPFLDLPPISVLGHLLDIKASVTHYLDMNFYNLTTVALHDWKTYSDMRSLALEKFGLKLMDNFLPMGSLDQGLDVLQIMRNIHIFVSRFTYNMNMQQFVEYRPDKASKHLNTIKIQSIAASIRQHGLGVLNTTVNFTYQFLSSKFRIFSQFLFDDHIKAHLSREHRWFKKHKNEPAVNNMYPYERALKFVQGVRKLGVNENNKSFLDQFRILVTEIGNALGYVRMVRSASMFYCSEAVKYLPEFEDIITFADHAGPGRDAKEIPDTGVVLPAVKGANLSDETVRAAKNLDEVIQTLVKNFGEGSDYFKVLVNVFQSVLLNSEHEHLKNFYIIVPAMCISWIDASLQAKDAMYKTAKGAYKEMYFTDDGFAMGTAYCLAILKQSRKHEALHFMDSISQKIRIDTKDLKARQDKRAVIEAERAKRKAEKAKKRAGFFGFGGKKGEEGSDEENDNYRDQEEIHSIQLTSKRIEAYRRETEQLFYSMSGAEIFFKRTDVDT